MSSTVKQIRPILGEDVEMLRFQLGYSVHDTQWQLGISPNKWGPMKNSKAEKLVPKLSLALLVRHLSMDPALAEVAKPPTARRLFDEISAIKPRLTNAQFAALFGREDAAAQRWLSGENAHGIVFRLFSCFEKLFAGSHSIEAKKLALKQWENIVASLQPPPRQSAVFQSSTSEMLTSPSAGPVFGEDVAILGDVLGIGITDTSWLCSLNMENWSDLTKHNPKGAVDDAALGILVRLLNTYPHLSLIPRSISPLELFDAVMAFDSSLTQSKFANMFGNEESSASKWLKQASRPGPTIRRLMQIFATQFEVAKQQKTSDVVAFIDYWLTIVEQERLARKLFLEANT